MKTQPKKVDPKFAQIAQLWRIWSWPRALQLFLLLSMTLLLCNPIPNLWRLSPALLGRVVSDVDLTSSAGENTEEPNQADEIFSDPESSRNRLHYSMCRLVYAILSLGRPLLFVLDDLQLGAFTSCEFAIIVLLPMVTHVAKWTSPVRGAGTPPECDGVAFLSFCTAWKGPSTRDHEKHN